MRLNDLNNWLEDFPKIINSTESIDTIMQEVEVLRSDDNKWWKQESYVSNFEDLIFYNEHNRYTVVHENVPFECLFIPKKKRKLYVMLSGGGGIGGRRYPRFLRWKYSNYLNGNILCIDDPMYYFHPEISTVMWYYGTKEKSYLKLMIDIVKKVMQQLSISAEEVTFVGSSGGGYAALYCANLLDYSSAIAMNPQIVLKDWHYPYNYNKFKKIGIDLTESDEKHGRNTIRLTNKKSKFMVLTNIFSEKEYLSQFVPFMELHNLSLTYGISQNKNIVTWTHITKYSDPHMAFFLKPGIVLASYFLDIMSEEFDLNNLNHLSMLINEELNEKYELKDKVNKIELEKNSVYELWIPTISKQIINIIDDIIIKGGMKKIHKLFDNDFELTYVRVQNYNIGYYIGKQRNYRYNLFYLKGNTYFRMKYGEFSKNFKNNKDQFLNELASIDSFKLTRWHIADEDTLIMTLRLSPINIEFQIEQFVKLTSCLIDKYL